MALILYKYLLPTVHSCRIDLTMVTLVQLQSWGHVVTVICVWWQHDNKMHWSDHVLQMFVFKQRASKFFTKFIGPFQLRWKSWMWRRVVLLSKRLVVSIIKVQKKVKRAKLLCIYRQRAVAGDLGEQKWTADPVISSFRMADTKK